MFFDERYLTVGPKDRCVQCGEFKDVIQASQRRGQSYQIFCGTTDYWGEVKDEWERHKFVWTKRDKS